MPFRVAVLTISDTTFHKGPEYDLSGPLLTKNVEQHPDYELADTAVVPDDLEAIQSKVADWVARRGECKVDWIITTGGTGFGKRDVTPQALSPHISPLPALLQYLTNFFLSKTPRAVLSRTVVGLYDRTLVLCLPGSKKACQEGWEAMTDGVMTSVIIHGLLQLQGGTGGDIHPPRESVRQNNVDDVTVSAGLSEIHDQPAQEPSSQSHECHHHHHHDHHHHHHHHRQHHHQKHDALSKDPSASVSGRLRKSPFPMISLQEALDIVVAQSKPLPIETVPTGHMLKNYVLAEDIFASADLPPTRTTNVDGYAVVADEYNRAVQKLTDGAGMTVRVVRAKDTSDGAANEQVAVYRINTGGPLPAGTDAVIMVEDTELESSKSSEDGQELEIRVLMKQVPVGDNVRQPGSDAKQGEQVLDKGTVIGSGGGEVGLLGFVGKREVLVHRRPRVAILSTGNELVELESRNSILTSSDTWTGVVDTNRPSLRSTLEGFGYEVIDLGIAPDTMDLQEQAMRKGMAESDIILTTGGTSMGEADLLKPLIEHRLGGTIHFGRVAMKPGKPTTFATVPAIDGDKLVFALPGNPASALVTFYLFVVPALRGLGGWPKERRHLARVGVQVDCDMKLDPREEFHRVIVSPSKEQPGVLLAMTTGGQRSSRVASLCGANGLVHLPSLQKGGADRIKKGEIAQAVLIGEIRP